MSIQEEKEIGKLYFNREKLLGRELELSQLSNSFCRLNTKTETGEDHKSELVLIGGASGIGKTSLVNAFRTKIQNKPHYFLTGKADECRRSVILSPEMSPS